MIISRLIALILLITFSPVLLLVALSLILDDGRPILFRQKRVGKNNNYFTIYKFRTMKVDTPDVPTHLVKDAASLYIKCGPLLRKLSLDELPQLINIIKGEMNFVGPRPALHNQDDLVSFRTKVGVHQLKPGVTGWAQINGRDELSIPEKVKLDEYYLNNQSLLLDCKIILLTVIKSLKMVGVSH